MNFGLAHIPSPSNVEALDSNGSNSMFWSPSHLRMSTNSGDYDDSPRFFGNTSLSPNANSLSAWGSTPHQQSNEHNANKSSSGNFLNVSQNLLSETGKESHSPPTLVLSPGPMDYKGCDADMFFSSSPRLQISPMTKGTSSPLLTPSHTPSNLHYNRQSMYTQVQNAPNALQNKQRLSQMQRQSFLMQQQQQQQQMRQQQHLRQQLLQQRQQQQQQQHKGAMDEGSTFGYNLGGIHQHQQHMEVARAVPISRPNGMFSNVHQVMQAQRSSFFDDADVAVVAAAEKRGSSCHQCKRKQPHSKLVFCTNSFDKKHSPDKRLCRKKFCYNCLAKFYQLANKAELESLQWQCPSCRLLCTCAACVRKRSSCSAVSDQLDRSTASFSERSMSYSIAPTPQSFVDDDMDATN